MFGYANLYGATYANGLFVVGGYYNPSAGVLTGIIVTSPDGVNWTQRNVGASDAVCALAYGNGTFVAVGQNGATETSSDGINWVVQNSGTTVQLQGLAYGNGFVAVGVNGTILSSTDGATWTSSTSGTSNNLNGVAYANGTFLAVGNSGTILQLENGLTPFSQWQSLKFGANATNNLFAGPSATPQKDGVPNLLKYLYDVDPTTSMSATDRVALPTLGMDSTSNPGTEYLALTYRENKLMTGITVKVQTSTDMQTWTTLTPSDVPPDLLSQQVGTDSTTGDPIMEVGVKMNGSAKQFIRLNVTSP